MCYVKTNEWYIKHKKKTSKALECTCAAYLGQVVNLGIVEFGSVSNSSPRHDSLFLCGHDRNIVEICDNVKTITNTKSQKGSSLFHYILQ